MLWFTSVSGSGRSTLVHAVQKKLRERGCGTLVLDGDNVRHGPLSNLGFSEDDRKENIRRIGEAVTLMIEVGIISMTAFITPLRADRQTVGSLFSNGGLIEMYFSAQLKVCEGRSVRGLYEKASVGEIKNHIGINWPYEVTSNPEIEIDTHSLDLDSASSLVLEYFSGNDFQSDHIQQINVAVIGSRVNRLHVAIKFSLASSNINVFDQGKTFLKLVRSLRALQ